MPSSVNSIINTHRKELMFPKALRVGYTSATMFLFTLILSHLILNLCFHPCSLDNTQNLQHGTFLYSLTQVHLKLLKTEHQQEATMGQGSPQLSHFTDRKTEAAGQSYWTNLLNKGSSPTGGKTDVY